MNVKFKSALAVAALTLAASAAQAAIPKGEIVFNIWNNNGGGSAGFTLDTGLALSTWTGTSAYSTTVSAAGILAAYNTSGTAVQWNVAGAQGLNYFTTTTDNNLSNLGSALGETNLEQSNAVANSASIYGALTSNTASTPATYWAASFSQGTGSLIDPTDVLNAGQNTSAYFMVLDTNANPTLFSGTWTLSFNGAKGFATAATLAWTPTSVGTVPLPAAVWLLGSGLMGLAGVGRRRKVQAA